MNWELVSGDDNEVMERAAVEDGWLYRNKLRYGSAHDGYTYACTMCFVPTAPAPAARRAPQHNQAHAA
jgi:hypothetical protein